MAYKKKFLILISLISVLTLTYIASFLFSAEFTGTRSAYHTWLDSRLTAGVSRIVITSSHSSINIVKRNNQWFISHNNNEYPVRQLRVGDFLSVFTSRAQWPVRYTNAESHPRLGLDLDSASRVTIYGDNSVLLDLLIGAQDTAGEVFVRRVGQNEVRSGSSLTAAYITNSVNSWYNLRLIPETEDGSIDVSGVQRLSVYIENQPPQVFTRRNRVWEISGIDVTAPDQNEIEAYIRTVLTAEGEDFSSEILPADPAFNYCRIVIELGTGNIRTIYITAPDESNRRYANVSGSGYVYLLPSWTAARMIREN